MQRGLAKPVAGFLVALLAKVAQLEPVSYLWRADEFPEKRFGTERVNGLIAQQVEQVLPELVTTDEDGYKRIDFSELPLLAIQAIRELKAENDSLRTQQTQFASKVDLQQAEISELREMLMSLQRQVGTQVSKAVTSGQ